VSPTSTSTLTARLARWIPAVGWLASYRLSWLRVDLAAGITVAAYLLPAGLGDASLANLPPEAGLYACLFGGLVFWLFCSSRHTTITVTSATDQGAHLGDDTLLISHSTPPTPHANTNCRRLFHPCWVLTWGSEPRVPGCVWRPRMASETAAAEQEAKAAGRGMWGPPCFGETTSVPE
jgi:hypothetical protein